MNKFKNPFVPLIENPVNIDRPIQEIQLAIASLGWLEKSFGRAWNAYKTTQQNTGLSRMVTYPHVWQGVEELPGGKLKPLDHLEVMPNDNLKSQSFFKVEDPIQVVEFPQNPDGSAIMRAVTSIIFWFDLRQIDPSIDYNYTELLKGQVQRKLTEMTFTPDSSLTILRIWEGAQNVFRGYPINEVEYQYLVYPFGGFRFELELTYREECPNTNYDLNNVVPSDGFITRVQGGGRILRS
jgi:hypothetical protein